MNSKRAVEGSKSGARVLMEGNWENAAGLLEVCYII